jgi:hypothetical protein
MIQNNNFHDFNHSNFTPVQKNILYPNDLSQYTQLGSSTWNHNNASNAQERTNSYNVNGNVQQQSSKLNLNSIDEIKSFFLIEIKNLKEEIIKLKQRQNDVESRQDKNDVKMDEMEIKAMEQSNGERKVSTSNVPTSDLLASYPLFDASLFAKYLTETSGILSNLITKSDRLQYHWVQQLR